MSNKWKVISSLSIAEGSKPSAKNLKPAKGVGSRWGNPFSTLIASLLLFVASSSTFDSSLITRYFNRTNQHFIVLQCRATSIRDRSNHRAGGASGLGKERRDRQAE